MPDRILRVRAQGSDAPEPTTPKERADITPPVFDTTQEDVPERLQVETTVGGVKRAVIVPSGGTKGAVRKAFQQLSQNSVWSGFTAADRWKLFRRLQLAYIAKTRELEKRIEKLERGR